MTDTSRVQALNEEEKPMVLAQAWVGGLDLDPLIYFLECAEDQAADAVRRAEMLLADQLE
jgi:hypothetical protein